MKRVYYARKIKYYSYMRIEDGLGADQFAAHITLEELDEICETMISAIKWRHANNEELTRKIVKDILVQWPIAGVQV